MEAGVGGLHFERKKGLSAKEYRLPFETEKVKEIDSPFAASRRIQSADTLTCV